MWLFWNDTQRPLSPVRGLSELRCRHAVGAGSAELLQSLLVKVQGYLCMWLCFQRQLYFESNMNCSLWRRKLVRLLEGRVDLVCLLSSALPVPRGQDRLPGDSVKISKPAIPARLEAASCEASLVCPCCPLQSSRVLMLGACG